MKSIGAIVLLWVFLSIPCCLCSSIPGLQSQSPTQAVINPTSQPPTAKPTHVVVQPTAKPAQTQAPAQPSVKMGAVVHCDECGFSFKQIPGYKLSTFGMIEDLAPDGADPDAGPDIQMIGGQAKLGLTESVFLGSITGLQNDKSGFTLSPQRNVLVGGQKAASFDVTYTINNIQVKGRRYGVLIPNKQILMFFAVGPVDQWDKMLPYVEALKDSITFFDPTPSS
ncbi:MAG: hypothetical protein P4L50_19210 [Anaerolineaceae bacterium]|nr:hypothetical protein [Anaerolineaceae bacterium]